MRLSRYFIAAIFIFCAGLPALLPSKALQAAVNAPLSIEKIRLGQHGQKTRIVLDVNQKTDFRVFHLASPPRIVVDMPPAKWHIARTDLILNPVLKGYRSGPLEDGLTRVIFDLQKPAEISEAYFLPKNDYEPNRLVVDLAPTTQNLFEGSLSEVFGNRDLKGPGEAPFASGYAETENRKLRDVAVPGSPVIAPAAYLAPRATLTGRQHRRYTIVVDAGHGGDDPGASGPYGIREKNITLSIAREIRRQLQDTGRYNVVLTRDRDVYIKLKERVEISRRVKGDLFISIHADKIARMGVRGASIYTLSETASDAETARLADDENNSGVVAGVDLAAESEDVAGILLDLAMREKMNESKLLSHYLENAFMNNNVRLLPNSHRAAGFAVLKAPDVPSVLIETGFLSNAEEAKLLTTSQFQRHIAGAIVDGVDSYFRKILALQKI
jgi:N-acetylmuramoyl-L-alanine amidase